MVVRILMDAEDNLWRLKKDNRIKHNEEEGYLYYDWEMPYVPIVGQHIGTLFGNNVVEASHLELHPQPDKHFYDISMIWVREI